MYGSVTSDMAIETVGIQKAKVSDQPLFVDNLFGCPGIFLSDGHRIGAAHQLPGEDPAPYLERLLASLDRTKAIQAILVEGTNPPDHDIYGACKRRGIEVVGFFPQSIPVYLHPKGVIPLYEGSSYKNVLTSPRENRIFLNSRAGEEAFAFTNRRRGEDISSRL